MTCGNAVVLAFQAALCSSCIPYQGFEVPAGLQCMSGVTDPLEPQQLQNETKCLPVQYKEGVYSLMRQAQLVGQPSTALETCMGLKPCM